MEYRVTLPEGNHRLRKLIDIPVGFQKIPVQPRDLIVLAVGIVVAVLGIAELVSGQQKRRSLA